MPKKKTDTVNVVYDFLYTSRQELLNDKIYLALKEIRNGLSEKININNVLFYINASKNTYNLHLNINGADYNLITIKEFNLDRNGQAYDIIILGSETKTVSTFADNFLYILKSAILDSMKSSRYLKVLLYDLTKIYR